MSEILKTLMKQARFLGDLPHDHHPHEQRPHRTLTPVQVRMRDEALRRLISRLNRGWSWLQGAHTYLMNGSGTTVERRRLEQQFVSALAEWCDLENILRELYGWRHCARGAGKSCPRPAQPVVCRACAGEYTAKEHAA